ncbi:MAG: hypothetical protein MUP81_06425 [Dehalococcoidia bacterium]|nr:hypothetical protein [Dehalococcoidia bacterium]
MVIQQNNLSSIEVRYLGENKLETWYPANPLIIGKDDELLITPDFAKVLIVKKYKGEYRIKSEAVLVKGEGRLSHSVRNGNKDNRPDSI